MEDTNKEREAFYGKENKQMRMIKVEKKNRGGGKEMAM